MLCGAEAQVHSLTARLRVSIALSGREAQPHIGLDSCLARGGGSQCETFPVILDAQVVLRSGVALIGGAEKPFLRLACVLRNALSGGVHQAEVILGQKDAGEAQKW